jgi:hypothetical protein
VITCSEFMAEFGDYLESEVPTKVRQQLEDHVAHCRTCQVICDSTRKTVKIVTDSRSFDLPESAVKPIVDRIMAKIRTGQGS